MTNTPPTTLSSCASALWAAAFIGYHTGRRSIRGIPTRIQEAVPAKLRIGGEPGNAHWVTLEDAWAELEAHGMVHGSLAEGWRPVVRIWQAEAQKKYRAAAEAAATRARRKAGASHG